VDPDLLLLSLNVMPCSMNLTESPAWSQGVDSVV
jgi:hypothetical protein